MLIHVDNTLGYNNLWEYITWIFGSFFIEVEYILEILNHKLWQISFFNMHPIVSINSW